jgi:hypothetical protein
MVGKAEVIGYFMFARHLFTMRHGAGDISEMPPTQLVKQLQ